MKKNKILLFFAILFTILFLSSMFIIFGEIKLREYWFSISCFFIGLYSLLYCSMYKLDSSFYYGALIINIAFCSFLQYYLKYNFNMFYPFYIFCFALASFAVFVLFRQKIHFKLFAILSIECILLIVYKLKYLNWWTLLIVNSLFIALIGINALFRINRNVKEN